MQEAPKSIPVEFLLQEYSEDRDIDPISTPRASNNSLAFTGPSQCGSHDRDSRSSLDLSYFCGLIFVKVAE